MTDTADLERMARDRIASSSNWGMHSQAVLLEQLADALAAQRERIKALEDVLGAIGWHELTWKEARDRARAALGARK